jgi:hypothetical protein
MTHNWQEMGISWREHKLTKRGESNGAERIPIGIGQVPFFATMEDVKKGIAAFGEATVLDMLNNNSLFQRVYLAQKTLLGSNATAKPEELREASYRAILGARQQKVTVTRFIYLPTGKQYQGHIEDNFEREYAADLVEGFGIPAQAALVAAKAAREKISATPTL